MLKNFTQSLFWDVDINSISIDEHRAFIVQRICMLGTWNDWLLLRKIYGIEKIKEELVNVRYLDPKTLNYFSVIFNIPKENFRCYTFQQSVPQHWNY